MKNIKNILALILLIISLSRISYSQEWEEQAIGSVGTEDFINLNHGWTVVRGSQGFTVLKTINKGVSWDSIYGFIGYYNSANISYRKRDCNFNK
ncbi:MAG TPA: hypothetical protein PKC91_15410 [Ignavibacteria bacterium]|nr:hypothetical protein [Ignavibacteria bacterium]